MIAVNFAFFFACKLREISVLSRMEMFRHRCGAQPSKLMTGRKVCGRFDPYTSPPNFGFTFA